MSLFSVLISTSLFKGPSLTSGSLSDLELPDILHYHMIGGPRSAVAQKLKKTVGAAAVGSGGGASSRRLVAIAARPADAQL